MRLSEAEWKVMKVVWHRHPVSVRDVLEELETETGWAYSTVKTVLTRLTEKGALTTYKRANVGYFEPRITERSARRSALRTLVDRAFDGTFGALVQHLAVEEKLSEQDREELRALAEELEGDERG